MTLDQLRRMHRARPFRPFAICLADGRRLSVSEPEFLAIFPSGRGIIVSLPDDTFEVVDLLTVTSLKAKSNGSSRRRAAHN